MTFANALEFLNSLIPCTLTCSYIYLLTNRWRLPDHAVKQLLIYCLLILYSLNFFVCFSTGFSVKTRLIIAFVSCFVSLSFTLYMTQYRDGRTLFIFFSSCTFVLAAAAMGEIVGSASTPFRLLIKLFIYLINTSLICRYLRKPLLELLNDLERGWYALALIPISLSFLYLAVIGPGNLYLSPNIKLIAVMLFLTTFCIYTALYQIFVHMRQEYQSRSDYRFLASQMKALQNQADNDRSFHKEMDIFRHDIRHFIQLQWACLEAGDLQGAKKGLEAMTSGLKVFQMHDQSSPGTGHLLIDSVLNNYSHICQEKKIDFFYDVKLPSHFSFEVMELAVIVSNALENAVQACEKIPSPDSRLIRLTAGVPKSQFMLEISNTYQEEVRFSPYTHLPLSDRSGHGYGTQSIHAFASKYHAFLEFHADGAWFRLRMILAVKQDPHCL